MSRKNARKDVMFNAERKKCRMQIAECRMGEANDEQIVGAIEIGIAIGITDCADIREKEGIQIRFFTEDREEHEEWGMEGELSVRRGCVSHSSKL